MLITCGYGNSSAKPFSTLLTRCHRTYEKSTGTACFLKRILTYWALDSELFIGASGPGPPIKNLPPQEFTQGKSSSFWVHLTWTTGWGKSRFTFVRALSTVYLFFIIRYNYCVFHTDSCQPTFAPPGLIACVQLFQQQPDRTPSLLCRRGRGKKTWLMRHLLCAQHSVALWVTGVSRVGAHCEHPKAMTPLPLELLCL